jgi:hypothetical protein
MVIGITTGANYPTLKELKAKIHSLETNINKKDPVITRSL